MTSKERVLRAFGRSEGTQDRVPLQFDLCRSLTDHFSAELGIDAAYAPSYYEDLTYRISSNELRTSMGSDVVVVGGTVADGFEPEPIPGGATLNEFGMHMKPTDLYVEVVRAPLEGVSSAEQVEAYDFPDPFAPGRFTAARRDIERFGDEYFVIGDVELTIFELAWHLTGMEHYLMALAAEEPWVEALNDRVEAWSQGLADQLVDAGADAVWFGEDLGTQTSMLISPDLWRERFRPRYERMIARLRRSNPNIMIIMHSDGVVAPLIDDFAEIGVDIYNPVQPNVPGSDPWELKSKYGDRICFFGGIDQQELLPSGNESAVRAEVARRKAVLGENGGYLLAPAHIIQADVSPETVRVFIDEAMR